MDLAPFVLEGLGVRLEPLGLQHGEGLAAAAADGSLWELDVTMVPRPEETAAWIEAALERHAGRGLSFATRLAADGRVVGSTSFRAAVPEHRRVEIGATWIARSYQRTSVNSAAKYLMLSHAFETWECIRVEFVTDVRNAPSRTALRRLGATEEGILRHHMIMPDGRLRDSACFSITSTEWPQVREALRARLVRSPPA